MSDAVSVTRALLLGVACVTACGCEGQTVSAPVALLTPALAPGASAATPLGKAGCVPNCRGKVCGTDGCGGHCGRCKAGHMCLSNRCVKDAAPSLCRQVAGRWKGVMQTRPYHYLDGRIYLWGKQCRGRFRVTYRLTSGPAWVVQEFVIRIRGRRMHMRGVRISAKSSNSNYNLDRFSGQLDKKLRRYTGHNRDVRNSVSRFTLNRK